MQRLVQKGTQPVLVNRSMNGWINGWMDGWVGG